MKRETFKLLQEWKNREDRKPLILRGARQVGKTWLMKEFGAIAYKNVAYVNFENNQMMRSLFETDFSIDRILLAVEAITGIKPDPDETLIIFDEIQEAPRGLTVLKYFCENAPQYHLMAAGSLWGVALHQGSSFPVGKVDFVDLYPMTFREFLMALEQNKKFVYGLIKEGARAREFELAIGWLVDCGLIYKIQRIKKTAIPLKIYEDFSAFKLYMLDCGLLGAITEAPIATMLVDNKVFSEFKGMFTEQYVLQQFIADESASIYYWSSERSDGELDFIIQRQNQILPIEVKAEENLHAKSLRSFISRHPELKGLRFSMSNYREEEWMTNIPLYAIPRI